MEKGIKKGVEIFGPLNGRGYSDLEFDPGI